MRKVSPRIAWCALASVNIVMVLGACMKPVDVRAFLEDERVQDIIDSTKVAVKVDDQTGDGLKGRDRAIEGLKSNRYYMVEKEIDADGVPVSQYNNLYPYPVYVTDPPFAQMPGGLYPDLGFITRIKDGRINGLINFHTYTVRAADPLLLSGNLPYTDDSFTGFKRVTGGTLTISGIDGNGFLNLSGVLSGKYEVIGVSADNSANSWGRDSQVISSWDSFKLEGPNTEIDYVFVKDGDPSVFKCLRVKIGPSVTPVTVTLDIIWIANGAAFSPDNYTFYQSDYYDGTPQSVTINVTNLEPAGAYTVKEWQYDGNSTSLGSGSSIILDNTGDVDYLALGTHTLTLICEKDGKPYSADFTLTVDP